MKKCRACGKRIPNKIVIDGKTRNTQRRQFCLDCSPWNKHNTKKILSKDKHLKVCSRCKKEKSVSEFHKKSGLLLHSYCKACLYEVQKARWIQKKKDAVVYLGGKCSKCGYNKNFSALSFHHRDANLKEFDWNRLRLRSDDSIKKELDKCDILCDNCHAEFHNPNCQLSLDISKQSAILLP